MLNGCQCPQITLCYEGDENPKDPKMIAGKEEETVEWYVMRVTYQRELPAQDHLSRLNIESFVPTIKVRRRRSPSQSSWRIEAAVHNYIFVHTTLSELRRIKQAEIPYLRYLMGKDADGQMRPQFVPAKQMEDFIAISKAQQAKYVDPDIDLREGERVRVIDGEFSGVEGVFIRISKRHARRVVVKIEGVAAIATVELTNDQVEKIL